MKDLFNKQSLKTSFIGGAYKLVYKVSIYYSIIGFLLILVILGVKDFGFEPIFWQIVPPLLGAIIAGLLFDFLETKKWHVSLGPVVSGLIIGLIGQFGEKTWVLLLIAFFAMSGKFFLKLYGKNVFNPAASGLLIGLLLFSSHPSWWGGEGYPWIFYLWIPGLLLKLKRWAPMVGFLAPVVLFNGIQSLTSGSLLFFTSIMLIEPITSPVKIKAGFVYGLIVGTTMLVLSYTNFGSVFDPIIPALLLGNIAGRILNRRFN